MRVLRAVVAVALAMGVLLIGDGATGPAAASAPTPTEWALPAFSNAGDIVRGLDGRMWFTRTTGLSAITDAGQMTTYPLPHTPGLLAAGPGGAVWAMDNDHIYRVSTSGAVTTFTPPEDPTPNRLSGIATGPDGNVWYSRHPSTVGKLSPAGVFTEYHLSTDPLVSIQPSRITAGPDGALWFLQLGRNNIGRITTDGAVSEFALPPDSTGELSTIASGPDGNLWIGFNYVNVIGRMTPAGEFTGFPGPQRPRMAASSDGRLWFAASAQYGTISPSGEITTHGSTWMNQLTPGPAGTMWYTASYERDAVGRLDPEPDPRGEFTPLTPARILDTRSGLGAAARPIGSGAAIDVQVAGRGGVPDDGVAAVVLNVTVTEPTGWGYLSVYPSGGQRPTVSNLNFTPGQTVANMATVALGTGGRLQAFNAVGTTHVIFDVVGYYADADGPFGSRFVPVVPQRAFDTRTGQGGVVPSAVGPGGVLRFDVTGAAGVPAAGVTAVVMNLTATAPTANTYLTAYPSDAPRPLTSSLNLLAGWTVPNLVTVRVPASGIVDVYNAVGSTHVLADVMGYYTTGLETNAGRFVAITPRRTYDSRVAVDFTYTYGKFSFRRAFPLYRGDEPRPIGYLDAAVLNATVTEPEAAGFMQVAPRGMCVLGQSSNLNFGSGQTVANSVVVSLHSGENCSSSEEGNLEAYSSARTHLVVDMFGYFTTDDHAFAGG
jgi:streptogramin lyase